MPSRFSERLDFLMSLTNTTNSALARELSFDASYISRIRSGKRGMPLHQPFIEPASAYLATRIRDPYQVQTAEQALHAPDGWPAAPEQGARLVANWLADDTATLDSQFDRLVESISTLPRRADAAGPEAGAAPPHRESAPVPTRYYIGNRGKRDATETFLSELVAAGKPCELLVYSDENMDWLSEDAAFARRWMALLTQLIAMGGTICIVHTITRDIGEMLDAVQKWLPLYLTGAIESHYCPRIRDGICRRTLFIARGAAALTSSSIEEDTDAMPTALVADTGVVGAYEREFNNLFELCRPLVNVAPLADDLAAEMGGASFAAVNPNAAPRFDECGLPVVKAPRLPEGVVAFVGEDAGFTLAHLEEPRIAMHVTERLLTAAFVEYLR